MKKFLIVLCLSIVCLGAPVSAQVTQSGSGSLQTQNGSSVQGTSNNPQSGSTQTAQGTTSLEQLTQSTDTIPLSSPSTTAQAPKQDTSSNSGLSAVQMVLIICLVLGAGIVGLIVWGLLDSRQQAKPAAETTPQKAEVQNPQKKKQKSHTPRRKRKKAHR